MTGSDEKRLEAGAPAPPSKLLGKRTIRNFDLTPDVDCPGLVRVLITIAVNALEPLIDALSVLEVRCRATFKAPIDWRPVAKARETIEKVFCSPEL